MGFFKKLLCPFKSWKTDKATPIEFAPMMEGLDDFCAPKPMAQAVPNWFKQMNRRVGGVSETDIPEHHRHAPHGKTIKTCPAIGDLFKVGYVIPSWCDFQIIISENGGFEWHSANPRYVIQFHSPEQLHENTTQKDELNYVVKFITPWRFKLPAGHLVYMKGLFYHTDLPFRACEGILDGSVTSTMNINTFWKKEPGTYTIKRGAPLVAMIPFKKQSYEMIVHSDVSLAEKWDQRNQTLLKDTFENTYRKFTDRHLHRFFR